MAKTPKIKPKLPRGRPGKNVDPDQSHRATAAEFEREGMGVAPKE
jgi:hypothetical protein